MKKTGRVPVRLLAVIAVVAACFVLRLWWQQQSAAPAEAGVTTPARAEPDVVRPHEAETSAETTERIQATARVLRGVGNADAARRLLGELKNHLSGLPREKALAAIRAALESGIDAASGLGFTVAPGGGLSDAPSLRVFLLDSLAQLDPAAAAEYARTILAAMNSPDEWAVALRGVALAQTDAAGRAFLEQKTREMLTHEPWQRGASAGFLEAFDVAVYLRGTSLVPELAALVRETGNRPAAHAAYLALDRLTIADPAPMLAKLADEPDLMQGREVTRANYFARADVRDAAQRSVVERYLLDARRTTEELQTFAGLYPNANFMVSQNLLTRVVTPDRTELAARDQAALGVVNQWLADARFASLRPQLQKTRSRLENFLRQADRGR